MRRTSLRACPREIQAAPESSRRWWKLACDVLWGRPAGCLQAEPPQSRSGMFTTLPGFGYTTPKEPAEHLAMLFLVQESSRGYPREVSLRAGPSNTENPLRCAEWVGSRYRPRRVSMLELVAWLAPIMDAMAGSGSPTQPEQDLALTNAQEVYEAFPSVVKMAMRYSDFVCILKEHAPGVFLIKEASGDPPSISFAMQPWIQRVCRNSIPHVAPALRPVEAPESRPGPIDQEPDRAEDRSAGSSQPTLQHQLVVGETNTEELPVLKSGDKHTCHFTDSEWGAARETFDYSSVLGDMFSPGPGKDGVAIEGAMCDRDRSKVALGNPEPAGGGERTAPHIQTATREAEGSVVFLDPPPGSLFSEVTGTPPMCQRRLSSPQHSLQHAPPLRACADRPQGPARGANEEQPRWKEGCSQPPLQHVDAAYRNVLEAEWSLGARRQPCRTKP